jgi:tetratricopeptide (TPR) repeat protein
MAAVDPYAPCPCGSGQKFKWCCHKVESYAEKAERLQEKGQFEAANAALDEGLRKAPDNPWLLTRKALIALKQGQPEEAKSLVARVLARQPDHAGALGLQVRLVLETEGPDAAAAELQQALTACPPGSREGLAPLIQLTGIVLGEAGHAPAARRHLELAASMLPDDDPLMASSLRMVEANPSLSPWLRNPYRLAPTPEGLRPEGSVRFAEALRWAEEGLWASAGSAFEALSADGIAAADLNAGLCRLWVADDSAAVAALRRYIARVGPTPEAVDLEALCQLVEPPSEDDLVDHVHLIWPLKRRDELLAAFRASDRVVSEGRGPLDPDDPNSFEVDQFSLLDRPKPGRDVLRNADALPRVLGRVLVAREIAILDALDDGQLAPTIDRLTALAGAAIPPAHPKTKVVDKLPRAAAALAPEWWLPEDADPADAARLQRLERARVVRDVWPDTAMPYLRGRTPRQAAKTDDAKVPLRAAICQLELSHTFLRDGIDFPALRASLAIEDEPEVDPQAVDVGSLHLARLHRVPADRLDDDRLFALWDRARRATLPLAMERATLAVIARPAFLDRKEVGHVTPFADLANLALSRQDPAEAFRWIERGRRDEPGATRAQNAVRWDMVEVRLRARAEEPESWVPQLAIVLERYRDDRAASSAILSTLVEMGLLQMMPHPDNPEQILLDSRPLQALLVQFGPKVTTATGELGVSASKGGLWTPGSPTGGGGGGIWTPGGPTGTGAGGDKPKLIIPGR